jgi:hypothetical protein
MHTANGRDRLDFGLPNPNGSLPYGFAFGHAARAFALADRIMAFTSSRGLQAANPG